MSGCLKDQVELMLEFLVQVYSNNKVMLMRPERQSFKDRPTRWPL